jgi:opacity protein-like surface antigen
MSYTLSFAAALILAPQAFAAPSEQAQTKVQQGTVTQSVEEAGAQTGSAVQSGIIPALTPPRPQDPAQQVSHTPKKDEDKGGIAWGSFLLYPDLSATYMYDDNVYASRKNEASDEIITVSPELRIKSNFSRHSLEIGTGVNINNYHQFNTENTNDSWVYGKGRIDITDATNIYGGASLSRDHEDRSSSDSAELFDLATATGVTLANPTRYTDLGGNVGIYHELTDRLNVRLGVSASELNFEDTPLVGGGIYSSDYRDRKETLLGGRVTFKASDSVNLFVQGMNDTRQYDISSTAFNHNSHGFNADIGMAVKPSDALSAEAYVGRMRQYYDNSAFENLSATDYGLNVKYKTTPWTTLSLDLDRSLEETTITDSSGYINTSLTGRVNHSLSRDLALNASLTRQWSAYNDMDRQDIYTGAGVGVKYYVTNAIYTGADYQYRHRNSTATQTLATYVAPVHYADYDNNLFYVTVGTDFGTRAQSTTPAFTYPSWSLFAEPFNNTLAGWYIGADIGMNSINDANYGLRDDLTSSANFDNGEFSNTGLLAGLFAGYGKMLTKHFYLGAEVEYDRSGNKLEHDHIGDLYFSIKQTDSLALSIRPGYLLDNGALLYGRLGYAKTTFANTVRAVDDVTSIAYTVNDDKSMDGFRLGLGNDIPMGNNLFLRMDYAYTDYKKYSIPVYNSGGTLIHDDIADMSSGTFKMGLGWNFGGSDEPRKVAYVDPKYLDGMYVGAMIGHGVINSQMNAIQKLGDVNQSTLLANFGNEGFTGGAFLGYGQTFGQWYIGAELEAEAATFGWHHDRTVSGTGGRDFYVHKKGGFGESVRLGYVLKNGSMFYGRVGRVDTKFNSIYERGAASGSPKYIDQDNNLQGVRIGLGTEVPLNKSLFMRMDYSYTNYESYTFQTGHATAPDLVTYNNDESMFRLGFGYHF